MESVGTPSNSQSSRNNPLICEYAAIISSFSNFQFLSAGRVLAIDIDPKKVEYAKHNAGIYGVGDKIEFMVGDFFILSSRLKVIIIIFLVLNQILKLGFCMHRQMWSSFHRHGVDQTMSKFRHMISIAC